MQQQSGKSIPHPSVARKKGLKKGAANKKANLKSEWIKQRKAITKKNPLSYTHTSQNRNGRMDERLDNSKVKQQQKTIHRARIHTHTHKREIRTRTY